MAASARVRPRCPRCGAGTLHGSADGLTSCLMCGEVISDEPCTLTKILSNSTPETAGEHDRTHFVHRLAPIEAPAEVKARVLAAIRREAGHA